MVTRWYPDTCACAIEYANPANAISALTVAKCAKHAAVPNNAQHLNTLLQHNQNKNAVLNWLTANIVSLGLPTLPSDGDPVLAGFVGYLTNAPAAVDPVQVYIASFTVDQVATLQAQCDTQFGVNHVKVSNTPGPIP